LDAEFGGHIESKSEAETKAAAIRAAIDAGTFERTAERRVRAERERAAAEPVASASGSSTDGGSVPSNDPASSVTSVTFDAFVDVYVTRVAKATGKASWKDDEYLLATVADHRIADGRRLGALPMAAITEDELEAFHAAQRAAGRAASTLNHQVQVMKAAFRWAARKGYVTRSPISDQCSLKRSKLAKRQRRLFEAEEAALLAHAAPRLHWIIVAALETGMRLGELLGLTWRDVNLEERILTVRAETAKDDETRLLPISSRLAAVLEMARTDPAGREYPLEAFVFGELGERVGSIKKSWETAVLKAHGVTPQWVKGTLSPECRAQLRRIDLHFHDLRREAASRWHEGGFQLHEVRDLLGHANVSQTDTYLGARIAGLRTKMDRFDATRGNPWQTPPAIEHRPLRHSNEGGPDKDQLH
jgi:integrase